METNFIMDVVWPVVLVCIGIAVVVLLVVLIRFVLAAQKKLGDTMEKVDPMLDNVRDMTDSVKPAVAKVDPLVDRVQLMLDAVNLEMMRVDEILEDVAQITDSASSATSAVDNIANAPIKAVNNVATRVKTKLGPKAASEESAELAEKRDAVARALADYKAASGEAADGAEAPADQDAGNGEASEQEGAAYITYEPDEQE